MPEDQESELQNKIIVGLRHAIAERVFQAFMGSNWTGFEGDPLTREEIIQHISFYPKRDDDGDVRLGMQNNAVFAFKYIRKAREAGKIAELVHPITGQIDDQVFERYFDSDQTLVSPLPGPLDERQGLIESSISTNAAFIFGKMEGKVQNPRIFSADDRSISGKDWIDIALVLNKILDTDLQINLGRGQG